MTSTFLPAGEHLALTRALCADHVQADRGFWSANRSAGKARAALEPLC